MSTLFVLIALRVAHHHIIVYVDAFRLIYSVISVFVLIALTVAHHHIIVYLDVFSSVYSVISV